MDWNTDGEEGPIADDCKPLPLPTRHKAMEYMYNYGHFMQGNCDVPE